MHLRIIVFGFVCVVGIFFTFMFFTGLLAVFDYPAFAATADTLSAEEKAEGFELLFDGTNLDGWKGDTRFWSVRGNAIVGQTTPENPTRGNTFLFYEKEIFSDFELRLSWRITGGNSGVQYRSKDRGGWVAAGYQADIDATNRYTGILYEERGRGIMAQCGQEVLRTAAGKSEQKARFTSPDAVRSKIKTGEWNDYVIIAKGNHLVQKINGVKTIDFTDEEEKRRSLAGILALQVHAGPPMKIEFRSVRIKRLPPGRPVPLFDGSTLAGWKRHEGLPGHGVAGKWFVEDGAIVGVQSPPGKGGFLTTYRQYRDFELTFDTKIDWPFDSGAFLRVGPHGKSHQVTLDCNESGDIGAIYCPWTRGYVQRCPEGIKHFKKDGWNHIKVRCTDEPARIEVWVNKTKVTDFQHTKKTTAGIPEKGTICLQVHPGGEGYDKSKARFKNIEVLELPVKKKDR